MWRISRRWGWRFSIRSGWCEHHFGLAPQADGPLPQPSRGRLSRQVKSVFDTFTRLDLCGYDLALKAAENYRVLRVKGITIRKTMDALIATRCIEDGLTLLHSDRDFAPFAKHLGLREAYSET